MTPTQLRFSAQILVVLLMLLVQGCGSGSGDCFAGQRDCACDPLGQCSPGLDCHQNTCVRPQERSVRVLSADARACEFVVRDADAHLTSVQFDDALQGTSVRRGDRTAVTFITRQDRPAQTGPTLRTVGAAAAGSDITLEDARCFDREGEDVGSASVAL